MAETLTKYDAADYLDTEAGRTAFLNAARGYGPDAETMAEATVARSRSRHPIIPAVSSTRSLFSPKSR